jgi:stress-induced morphogen
MPGPIETRLREKIESTFTPVHMELVNESHQHSVPRNSETHFKLVLVSSKFEGLSRIQRQRLVNECVADDMKNGVHALTQRTLTPLEWEQGRAANFESPECHGGSKHDKK